MKKIMLMVAACLMGLVGCNANVSNGVPNKMVGSVATESTETKHEYQLKENDRFIVREGGAEKITSIFTTQSYVFTDFSTNGSVITTGNFEVTIYYLDDGVDVSIKDTAYIEFRGNCSYTLWKQVAVL